jgi:hypothetical protein
MAEFKIEMKNNIDVMKQDQDKKHDELIKLLKNQGSRHRNKQGSTSSSSRSSSPPPPPPFLYNIEIEPRPKEFDPVEGERREIVLHMNIHTSFPAITDKERAVLCSPL